MLINSVIIILREVLEAALIISVLLALSQKFQLPRSWVITALLIGLVGAYVYATNIESVSMALEGVGQEMTNASLHLLIYSFIVLLVITLKNAPHSRLILLSMTSCVAMATIREGSEIIIYISGFMSMPELFMPVIIGAIVGTGIGVSIGVFFYYLIANMAFNKGVMLGLFLLILIAGGMILQATQLLIQADYIVSQQPLWDSSSLINERSLIGQLLYALIGYEATPSPIQVICYFTSVTVITFMTVITLRNSRHRESL
ncbi:MAG: FTR1 family protein [Methylophagaceae bacterium]